MAHFQGSQQHHYGEFDESSDNNQDNSNAVDSNDTSLIEGAIPMTLRKMGKLFSPIQLSEF